MQLEPEPTTRTARPGPLHVLAALLVPLALIAAWSTFVLSYEDIEAEDVQMTEGGKVRVVPPDAQVIVVGNSLVYRGVDPVKLKQELGVQGAVYLLTYPGSWAPWWYAALKNQVYAKGHRPKLVVVVNTLEYMLRHDRPDGRRETDLKAVMSEDEPVIQQKVYGARAMSGPLVEIDDKRGRVGESWIRTLLSLPYLTTDNPHARSQRALADVFEKEGATDVRLNTRVIPIVETEGPRRSTERDPSESLIPDIIDIVEEAGSRLVFARIPVSRVGRRKHPLPSRATERATVAMFNEREVGYVDLHGLNLPATAFVDDEHMTRAGQQIYTKALAERLVAIDAMGDSDFPEARLPPKQPDIRREGKTYRLPLDEKRLSIDGCRVTIATGQLAGISDRNLVELGLGAVSPVLLLEDGEPLTPHTERDPTQGCEGTSYHYRKAIFGFSTSDPWEHRYRIRLSEDFPILPTDPADPVAWWVYPGTSLVIEFDEEADFPAGETSLDLTAVKLGRGKPPTIEVDGQSVEHTVRGLRVTAEAPIEGAPRVVKISAPLDGAFVLVRHVGIHVGDQTFHFIGTTDERDTSVRMLAGAHEPEVTPLTEAPTLEHEGLLPPDSRGQPWAIRLPKLRKLSNTGLAARTGTRQDLPEGHPYRHTLMMPLRFCSPVRVFEDGAELNRIRDGRQITKRRHVGAYSHRSANVEFWPIGLSAEGHDYTVKLADNRMCWRHMWLYPGDEIEIRNPEMTKRLYSGADTLRLGGFAFGNRDNPILHVTVESAEGKHLEFDIRAGHIEGQQARRRLTTRLPPRPEDVVVRIRNAEDGPYVLMQVIAFDEEGRPSIRKHAAPIANP